ncbi:SHOCT domain-containing protein [Streptomyces sp. TRM68416]|uniref:SHOCT domain-containing protein n=1 Tax=Streptomyces sp. TRM68416 TaxID=2758412 RepID=UPI001661CE84|nr:SHOCT domain-containing protein [Streptomyces sp. TRM68416]MBD0839440.1 SHOCT domain-containing protein [Streptomyces sp. TRM68416]
MLWYDHDVSGWGWFAMSASMIVFWALFVALGVLLFRALTGNGTTARPRPTPEELLAERFARGEIDEDEYHRRLAVLHADGGPRPGKS